MKEIPKIGQTYNCYDDGKVSESRKYEVTITNVIPFRKANNEILKMWEDISLSCDWLFDKTDYFVEFNSTENKETPKGVFARTKDGGWFGLGNIWNSGRLDIDGSLTKYLADN